MISVFRKQFLVLSLTDDVHKIIDRPNSMDRSKAFSAKLLEHMKLCF